MASSRFVTPKGVAIYPNIHKEDHKYGGYKVDLRVPKAEAEDLVQEITTAAKELGPKAQVKLPFWQDEETGDVVFRAKSKFQPTVVDAKGRDLKQMGKAIPAIVSGSKLKIAGSMKPYDQSIKGVKLYLNAVKVLHLIEINRTAFEGEDAEGDFDPNTLENAPEAPAEVAAEEEPDDGQEVDTSSRSAA